MQLQGLTLNLRQTSSTCLPCMMHADSAAGPTKPLALCRSGLCLSGSIGKRKSPSLTLEPTTQKSTTPGKIPAA